MYPVCADLQGQILACYKENVGKTLHCSNIAALYLQCVNNAKQVCNYLPKSAAFLSSFDTLPSFAYELPCVRTCLLSEMNERERKMHKTLKISRLFPLKNDKYMHAPSWTDDM